MEKVLELIRKIAELKEVERKKKEMEQVFKKEFGIEPETVKVDRAKRTITEGEVVEVAEQILRDLGYDPRWVKVILYCSRCYSNEEMNKETDWELNDYGIGLVKYSNGFYYSLKIEWEDYEDC